jgi:hypothetical protein
MVMQENRYGLLSARVCKISCSEDHEAVGHFVKWGSLRIFCRNLDEAEDICNRASVSGDDGTKLLMIEAIYSTESMCDLKRVIATMEDAQADKEVANV